MNNKTDFGDVTIKDINIKTEKIIVNEQDLDVKDYGYITNLFVPFDGKAICEELLKNESFRNFLDNSQEPEGSLEQAARNLVDDYFKNHERQNRLLWKMIYWGGLVVAIGTLAASSVYAGLNIAEMVEERNAKTSSVVEIDTPDFNLRDKNFEINHTINIIPYDGDLIL